MSPAHVHEPTYRRLKRAILKGGWPMGAKLEAVRLADDFGVSMTPVRDSLNRLVGEGLVDLTHGEGFRVAAMSELRLREILKVNLLLLEHALKSSWMIVDSGPSAPNIESFASRVGTLFAKVAVGTRNGFLAESVLHINERLHLIRELEPEIVPTALPLLSKMERSLQSDCAELHLVIEEYHEACMRHVPQLISASSL